MKLGTWFGPGTTGSRGTGEKLRHITLYLLETYYPNPLEPFDAKGLRKRLTETDPKRLPFGSTLFVILSSVTVKEGRRNGVRNRDHRRHRGDIEIEDGLSRDNKVEGFSLESRIRDQCGRGETRRPDLLYCRRTTMGRDSKRSTVIKPKR